MLEIGRNAIYVNSGLLKVPNTKELFFSDDNIFTGGSYGSDAEVKHFLGPFLNVDDAFRGWMNEHYTINYNGMINYQSDFVDTQYTAVTVVLNEAGAETLQFTWTANAEDSDVWLQRQLYLNQKINSCRKFYDFYFKRVLPVRYNTLESLNRVGTVSYVHPQTQYNYLVSWYEKFLVDNPGVSERVLPSFYALYAQGVYKQTNMSVLNSLNNTFPDPVSAEFLSVDDDARTGIADSTLVKNRYIAYLKKYAVAANNYIANNSLEALNTGIGDFYSTYMFTDATIPLLTTEAVKGEMFPFYNQISFSTDRNTTFANILRELSISDELMKMVISDPNPVSQLNFGRSTELLMPPASDLETEPAAVSYEFTSGNLKMWDLKHWIQFGVFNANTIPTVISPERSVGYDPAFIKTVGAKVGDIPTYTNKIITQLFTKLVLSAKVNRLSAEKSRNIKEMFDGVACYSEAVFYKIEKFGMGSSTTPLHTYYIPNSTKLDVCNFIDTQVKYGSQYTYKIISYVLVLGNNYSYNGTDAGTVSAQDPNTARISLGCTAEMRLVEVPIDTIEGLRIMDHPPIAPVSSIVGFRGIENRILINLNGATGDVVMEPIPLEPGDLDLIALQRQSQRRSDTKLRFLNDDAPSLFEVFRTTQKPRAYLDFEGTKIAELSTQNISTSAAFQDSITPNIDYYYVFRSRDIHGNISNPTAIYQVKMIKDSSPPYLVVKPYDLNEEMQDHKKKVPSKSMRRYIQIIPTTPQGLLNVEQSNLQTAASATDTNSVVLGVADETVWGEKFKIRFTSKKTGRKIDLDFIFDTEHQLSQS